MICQFGFLCGWFHLECANVFEVVKVAMAKMATAAAMMVVVAVLIIVVSSVTRCLLIV